MAAPTAAPAATPANAAGDEAAMPEYAPPIAVGERAVPIAAPIPATESTGSAFAEAPTWVGPLALFDSLLSSGTTRGGRPRRVNGASSEATATTGLVKAW